MRSVPEFYGPDELFSLARTSSARGSQREDDRAGYKTWPIEPQPGDLSWANGRVPTPYGPIEVKWEKQDDSFVLEFSVPDGTRGYVGVPFTGNSGSLTLNGHSVKTEGTAFSTEGDSRRAGYAYVRNLTPGIYRIVTP